MASKSPEALERRRIYQREYRREWRERHSGYDHAAHYARYNHKQTMYRREIRSAVYEAYGNQCVCCGETRPQLLTLDHVNHDGSLWRKAIGRSTHSLALWAVRNGFPKSLQILCWNCNAAREYYGTCPHQAERWKELDGR